MPRGFQDVHLEIYSTIDALEVVQAVAERIARQLGLGEEDLDWTTMAVREAVVNAIKHGNQNDPAKLVFIDFSTSPDGDTPDLIVRVRDQGPGFDGSGVADPLEPTNVLKTSGRGIFLIKQFMDDVTIQRAPAGGTEIRMLKHIRPA